MKLLIISHNCISNNNNMGKAILSTVSSFKKEELCQIYIYPSIPDIDICNSYYRITDKEVLKSIFRFNNYGKEIDKSNILDNNLLYENIFDQKVYKKKSTVYRKFLRDFIWKSGYFVNNNLKIWLQKEKPTHILVFPGKYCFFYDFALKISKLLNIPIITYFMDDYYNLYCNNLLDKWYQKKLNNRIFYIVNYSSAVLTLCEEMTKYYSKEFNKHIETIMLGSKIINNNIKNVDNVKNISYFGNMSYKRYLNLIDIGKALDSINLKTNKDYKLNIYGEIYNNKIIELFKQVQSIKFYGFLKGEEYNRALSNADILVHIESFDKQCIENVKHSISTKISQIITSGRCVLTYGPSDVASINYLIRTESAFAINTKDDLEEMLIVLLNNKELRERIAKNGYKAAKENQDALMNSKKIYKIIENINKRGN